MGREIKRVPLDFDLPIDKVWPGFLRPDELDLPPCPDCRHDEHHSTGYSREAWAIANTFYAHMISDDRTHGERLAWNDKIGQAEVDHLVAEHRLGRDLWTVVPLEEPFENDEDGDPIRFRWDRNDKPNPTAAEVNAAQSQGFMGAHDGINRMLLIRFRCDRLGIPLECAACNGRAEIATDEQRAANEAWEETPVPEGDGWQLWSTTTEGHPMSPVFATGDELARWMSQNPCGFAGSRFSLDVAMKWVHGSGWSPSMMSSPATGLLDGVTAAVVA